MTTRVDLYWKQFIDSLPASDKALPFLAGSDSFGFNEEDARDIADLILDGTKTATGSLLWTYEADGERVPQVGDFWIVTKGHDDPVCVIETIDQHIITFDQVPSEYAWEGGEGDRTVEGWRRIYWQLIQEECVRIGRVPSAQAPLVMERFRVIYKEPFRPNV